MIPELAEVSILPGEVGAAEIISQQQPGVWDKYDCENKEKCLSRGALWRACLQERCEGMDAKERGAACRRSSAAGPLCFLLNIVFALH